MQHQLTNKICPLGTNKKENEGNLKEKVKKKTMEQQTHK